MDTENKYELEGIWEDILKHNELQGCVVRVTVLSADNSGLAQENKLSKYAGKWQGNDLEECLQDVYDNRDETEL